FGASLGTAGPGEVRIRSGYARLSVHARTCRRLPLAGECRRPVSVYPVVVHDDANDLLNRVHLVVVKRDLESETAARRDLHPIERKIEALQLLHYGLTVQHHRCE